MSRFAAIGGGAVALTLCACSGDPAVPAQAPSGWTQRFPTSGLSKVEATGDAPNQVTLEPNAALVDGVLDASAGLDLGYGATAAGDRANRDLGAQLPDATTAVNLVCVRVDRPLSPSVAAAFAWTAYASADNAHWTSVPIAGFVAFATMQNRFEIPIPLTWARYLKVTTQPLAPEVTTDQTYSDVFVTELTLFSVTQ
jgi:hypothetical protein